MRTVSLSVPGISCGHCKASIEEAVSKLEGVGQVTVHVDPRRVDLAFDEGRVSLERIVEAIEDQGYEVPTG